MAWCSVKAQGQFYLYLLPPLASYSLLTTFYPLLENVLQTVDHFEISASELHFQGWKSPEIAWGEM
jgi:hypothetical protein